MGPFATVEELVRRLDFDLSEQELAMAETALEDASALVRAHGKPWPDPALAPAIAKSITVSAARRFMVNPDGLMQSRAGDETLAWDGLGEQAGSVYLTKAEIKLLQRIARPNGITAVPLSAWGPVRERWDTPGAAVYVPADNGEPFPYYAEGDLGVGLAP